MGGEEFAVLAMQTPLEMAFVGGERLRKSVVDLGPIRVGNRDIAITISVGVASLLTDGPGTTAEDVGMVLYSRADAAPYRAKENGRNGVVSELE